MDKTPLPSATDDLRQALIGRLARRVREIRKHKGMPRRVVSELSGVSPRYLAQLEAGEGNISIALLARVARALDVPIEALISRRISVDPQIQKMSALLEQAPPELRAQVMALLTSPQPAAARRTARICLLGVSGAGKTTLGRMLGAALALPFVELGSLIEQETGMTVSEVLSLYGADGFRRLEAEALERVIGQGGPLVLAASCGLVDQAAPSARLLERFHTIWLHTTPAEVLERARAQGRQYTPQDAEAAADRIRSEQQICARFYGQAHAHLDTSGCSPDSSLRALMALCRDRQFVQTP